MSEVIVACNLPNGVRLRLHKPVNDTIPLFGGGVRDIVRWEATGDEVVISGIGHMLLPSDVQKVNGYALTTIDADFWDEWKKQNKDSTLLENGSIFAHEKTEDVRDQSKEQRKDGVKSGLEPLDPHNLPKGMSMRKMDVTTADEMPTIRKPRDPDAPQQRQQRIKRA